MLTPVSVWSIYGLVFIFQQTKDASKRFGNMGPRLVQLVGRAPFLKLWRSFSGTKVKAHCGPNRGSTCEPCDSGTFFSQRNSDTKCQNCSQCLRGEFCFVSLQGFRVFSFYRMRGCLPFSFLLYTLS